MESLVATIKTPFPNAQALKDIISKLEREGLSIINPATGRVTGFNSAGEQTTIVYDALLEQAKHGTPGNMQIWFPTGADVFISWDLGTISFFLDGLSAQEERLVLASLLDYFRDFSEVGDRRGWAMNLTYD